MPEICLSGSVGGAKPSLSLPLSQPRVSTLGTFKINEFALKGREADLIKLAPLLRQKLECVIETCYNWTYFRVVSRFDLPPLQGEALWAAVPRVETLG
jgi:hypothetical protein